MRSTVYKDMFPLVEDTATEYRLITPDHVSAVEFDGETILKVAPEALARLAAEAMRDTQHLLRSSHLARLRAILDDDEASDNDKFVALEFLKNANVAAGGVLPMCQDTGTAIVFANKGQRVWTDGDDKAALTEGIHRAYAENYLRYSQLAALDMYEEVNTGNNLPAQIDINATKGDAYDFLFMAKGGGSANKTFLFQETRALLTPERLMAFLEEKIIAIGTAACPPYYLAIVIGGTSAEMTLKTVKLASARYLDGLPTKGNKYGQAFRDLALERAVHEMTHSLGIGAQFGGKYFCHDVRVIRLPRHGASCPVGLGVSCAADRQILGKITAQGVYLEQLETDPAKYLPEVATHAVGGDAVAIELNQPMDAIRNILSGLAIETRVSLTGPMIVARDIAHAKLKEGLDRGEGLPQYFKDHCVYYAGPAKTPAGYATGAFGPTTAGRMDSYVADFQDAGGSFIMLAKGNRSRQVTEACQRFGGFYLCSVGGEGALLAQDCIRKVECIAYPELGMEAIWRIEVENFPAFLVVDDKGNDFFSAFGPGRRRA
ncbi:MAG: fumarate hydratase [Rhodospirillales bacterium]|jgi:fumarate hydratase class I|nr:fumarate hydratase [Rhodospirillales bacterium]